MPNAHVAYFQSNLSSPRPIFTSVSFATAPSLGSSPADQVDDEVRRTGVG
jgi:hypothetical protein